MTYYMSTATSIRPCSFSNSYENCSSSKQYCLRATLYTTIHHTECHCLRLKQVSHHSIILSSIKSFKYH